MGPFGCVVEEDEEVKYEGWFWEGPFKDGDESGASIVMDSRVGIGEGTG